MRIEIDPRRNTLTLIAAEPAGDWAWHDATVVLDIGEGGRLLSLETETRDGASIAFEVSPMSGTLTRSAVAVGRTAIAPGGELRAIEIPRRTPAFEITFPSGNQ